ncbi:phospho-sugar mutase [Gordonia sp. PDNC005]|uniref:phospho-sugar mutase n=1 Tax=Gordonia sp. PDNC005 TaxID=2811424 RepID=UPI0019630BE7|nr:phospho-sugar mutase [Gordonia sp. PDNC005]QRY63482.1 phospho-sugar mutase [Gordonia sp. PDNC005]
MLSFGTAGLRGPVRDGPDGMNVENVVRATAGLAAWLIESGYAGRTVVVGRDARHGSEVFAEAAREVFAGAGFDVIGLPEPGPTPLVAFGCRALDAAAGVMITASHNPPADNGYKVYLGGGAQLISPDDREIEAAISRVEPASVQRTTTTDDGRGDRIRGDYLARLATRFPRSDNPSVRIALTAMHGVGGALAVEALAHAGFTDVHPVTEQFTPDPDFPTVAFPNPEEPGATDLLLATGRRVDADLLIALDPDADRCAVGVRDGDGWRMLTGDETGALLGEAILQSAPTGSVVASSIVSGTLMHTIALSRGFDARRTLTGFKWLVRAGEPLVYAYEEALGHCVDPDAVRDKDGISAAVACALIAHSWHDRGGLSAALDTLMARHGVHVTGQRSVRFDNAADGAALLRQLRERPPTTVEGFTVAVADYAERTDSLRTDGLELAGSDDAGGTLRVMVRPSGTEPKIKFYGQVTRPADIDTVREVRKRAVTTLQRAVDSVLDASRTEEPNR